MYYPIVLRLSGTGSTGDEAVVALHERVQIHGAKIVDAAGITANNTNYAHFKVLGNDQSTTLFEWSTQDTEEGTLAADTVEDLVDLKKANLAIFDAGEAIKVQLTKGGSIAADACLVLECRDARNY
jgi:hypothetical protein